MVYMECTNRLKFQGVSSLVPLGDWAAKYVSDFWLANATARPFSSPLARGSLGRWRPSKGPVYKVNIDASFLPDSGLTGIGIIIRDNLGQVHASASKFLGGLPSVDFTKGLVVVHACRLACELGFSPIVMETDSLRIFRLLQAPLDDISEVGALMSRFHEGVFSQARSSCLFVSRSGNEAAHRLSKLALFRCSDEV